MNNINYSPELHFEAINRYLQSQDWFNADIETWHLCAACSRAYDQESFDSVWSTIPEKWLVEINRIWCEASNYRFGFSVQRGLWEELIKLSYSVDNSLVTSSDNEAEAARIFCRFLKAQKNCTQFVELPAGFYPRSGLRRVWAAQGYYRGPQLVWDNNCLIKNFSQVHSRLVDCGIPSAALDEATRKKLRDLYIDLWSPSKVASKAKMSSISDQARANRSTTQLKNPSRIQARTPHEVGEPYENIMLAALVLFFILFVLIVLFG